jgi:hypothetical protein
MLVTILQQRLSIFYLYKENPLFNAYISKSRAGSRNGKSSANSLAATTKQLFYYQSSADGDIKQIRESVEQLDNNIKASLIRFLITNSVHFLMRHYSASTVFYP